MKKSDRWLEDLAGSKGAQDSFYSFLLEQRAALLEELALEVDLTRLRVLQGKLQGIAELKSAVQARVDGANRRIQNGTET